MDSVR